MLEYSVTARRRDATGSSAGTRDVELDLDTSLAGRPEALNPAELLLAALAACMIKGVERAAPMIRFDFRGVEVRLHAVRQDAPPKIVSIDYELIVDSDEPDHKLELLHTNVRKYGTVSNTLAAATSLNGVVRRGG
ncbi:MAG: OsmC family protein [Devosia sp.]